MKRPSFAPGDLDSLNKLFLELSLVCEGAKTWRDIQYEAEISRLNSLLAEFRAKVNQQSLDHAGTEHQRHVVESERNELRELLELAMAKWISFSGNRTWGADEAEDRARCAKAIGPAAMSRITSTCAEFARLTKSDK